MTVSTSENSNKSAEATEAAAFFAMTDMLRYTATAKDASFPVKELFFEPGQGVLRFVALDVGGWFDRREVIVSTRLMAEPDETSRDWPVDISPEAIKEAPEWSDPKALEQMPLVAMPPIMVGPLGGHFAGSAPRDAHQAQETEESPGNLKVDGFARFNDWVGLPVFGRDGEVGTLIDFLFEPETGHLTHLVIDTGRFFASQQMCVPYDLLRHLAKDGTYVVMNVTAKILREAPPLEHFDKVNRSWLDKLRSYYQVAPRL